MDKPRYKADLHTNRKIHFHDDLPMLAKTTIPSAELLQLEKKIIDTLVLEERLHNIFYSVTDYERHNSEIAPIVKMLESMVKTDYSCKDFSLYPHWLNFNFSRKSLYVAYQGMHKRCLFSYTSGMFLPKDVIKRRTKQERSLFLKNLRLLKKKERKRERRKLEKVT